MKPGVIDVDEPVADGVLAPMLRRDSLATRAAQILKRYIVVERLEPGHRLPAERRLADWLNVSRTVLREALSLLIGEGILVRPTPHALCVADFDRARLAAEIALRDDQDAESRDLVELRVVVEIGAIEAIVQRASAEDLRAIERWVVEGERSVAAGEPIYRADARFHAALLRALGNRVIDGFLPLIEEHLRHDLALDPHQLTSVGTPADHRVVAQHRQIFEAVKRRDGATARRLMRAHLTPYLLRGSASATDTTADGGFGDVNDAALP